MIRWLAGLLLLLTATAAAGQSFPPLTGQVVDLAGLLSPAQVARLTQLSDEVERASTRQLVVATLPDLQGYTIEDYGYRLGRTWRIGQGGANNGVILIVAPREKRVRIEVGYGLEPIMTDALSSIIVNDTILPRFRDGDAAGGIVAGAEAIAAQLRLPLEAGERRAAEQVRANGATSQRRDDGGDAGVAIFWLVVILFVVLPLIRSRARGRRYRGGLGPVIVWGSGLGGGGGGGSSWGGGGGGFSGGGGSFGGGGASGSW